MKIAYLVNQYPKVSHSFIRREIAALEADGLDVVRFTIRPAERGLVDPADLAESARTRVLLGSVPSLLGNLIVVATSRPLSFWRTARLAFRIGRSSERGLLRHVAYLVEACTLARWLSAGRAEHLHAHFGTNPSVVATLCRELGGPPFSFTVHCHEELQPGHLRSFGEKVRRAAFVAAANEWVKGELAAWCEPRLQERIHVVRCGLGDAFLNAPETAPPDTHRLVCVARLCADKGQGFLLEAAVRLASQGRSFELLLVGDGTERAKLEQRIRTLGLADRVRVTGWKSEEEVASLLLSARALVLPSLSEGLPVVIMEAMALRRPVVATDVGAVSELVESGVTGWLIPSGSVEALTSAVTTVLDTPVEALARMGNKGAERVAQHHDVRREASRLRELFGAGVSGGEHRSATREREPASPVPAPNVGAALAARLGVVVIGRNEGGRLVRCLRSVDEPGVPIAYVDSGSTDGSAARARELGTVVVELDPLQPFTAARARNAGFEQLTRGHTAIEVVQFVDGDCELRPGWLDAGFSFLNANPDVAVVCGHLRERTPLAGPYQRLADIEWASPAGDVLLTTGSAMVRAKMFAAVGGFDPELIGGEEPDLCMRLNAHGARAVRIDCEMALHEMAMTNIRQWWRRCMRAGHSYAELYIRHGATNDRQWRRKLLSITVWALLLPTLVLLAAWRGSLWSIVLLSAYGVLFARIVRSTRARGVDTRSALLYAGACIVGKFAELQGVVRYLWSRVVRRQPSRLIEYRKKPSVL